MKRVIYLMLGIILLLSLASCGETETNKGEGTKVQGVGVLPVSDIAEYKIVRGENCSDGEKSAAVDFHKTLMGIFDGMKITADDVSTEKEILIGHTKRKESKAALEGLKYHDFVIKRDGDKIVIAGGSDESLAMALDLVKAKLLDGENARLLIPAEEYRYIVEYKMDKLSYGGKDVGEFKIFNHSYMKNEDILSPLSLAYGYRLEVAEKMTDEGGYIVLDGSGLIADEYKIEPKDGNIYISGSAHSLPAALEAFCSSYPKSFGTRSYSLTEKDVYEGSTGKKEIYTKDQLLTLIADVYADKNHVIVGQQLSGKTKHYVVEEDITKYEQATGEKPGIIGIDLACYGIDLMETTALDWSAYICDIVDYCADGGIITVSAHWANPSGNTNGQPKVRGNFGYTNSLEAYEQAFTELLTEGTEYNEIWMEEIDTEARFLAALRDNGVPLIWRPLHEANGNFFWYCIRQQNHTLDASYVVNIWKYIHNYFTNDKGLDNLIWCYAPNYSANIENKPGAHMSNTYLYPGDEYCDMVGVDWYSGGKMEITTNDNYLKLTQHAKKPGAITEFGPGGDVLAEKREDQPKLFSCMDLYGNLYALSKEGYSFVYVLTWTGDSGVEVMGRGDEYLAEEMTLSQSDVKALFDAMK